MFIKFSWIISNIKSYKIIPDIDINNIKDNWTEDEIILLLKDDAPNELFDKDNDRIISVNYIQKYVKFVK